MSELDNRKMKLYELLKLEVKDARISHIEQTMAAPDFWNDQETATKLSTELSHLKQTIEEWEAAETEDQVRSLELKALLSDEYDAGNAIVSFHAGAGGTEAMDWTGMLKRMVERWAEGRDFVTTEIDQSFGEEVFGPHQDRPEFLYCIYF